MRISDWSSDVFSSDLDAILALGRSLDDLDRLARDAKSGVDNLTTNTRPISGAVDALSEAVAAATQGIDQGRSQTGDLDAQLRLMRSALAAMTQAHEPFIQFFDQIRGQTPDVESEGRRGGKEWVQKV